MRMWIRWLALLLCICGGLAGTASAMQETDAQELQACISMLEKYILRLRKEIDEKQ